MAEEHCELRKIAWSEVFPFLRLFATCKRATAFRPMVLAFCCVGLTYACGRLLDWGWTTSGAGVITVGEIDPRLSMRPGTSSRFRALLADAGMNEIEVFATRGRQDFESWKHEAEAAILKADDAGGMPTDHETKARELAEEINKWMEESLQKIDASASSDAERQKKGDAIRRAADILTLTFAGYDPGLIGSASERASAVEELLAPLRSERPAEVAAAQSRLTRLLATHAGNARRERHQARGPFISLLDYEMRCFSAAIHGVCNGRWGMSGSALSSEPAMVGSIASAGEGVLWLITQRPCFATIFTIILLIVFAFFGGAICRIAALQSTREQPLSMSEALRFSREKFSALVAAPVLPILIFAFAWLLLFVGGAISALPVMHVVEGLLYGLALLGGMAMAATLLSVILGFHLMWPTIAVEASDSFDAVQRAAGYVFSRAWHVAFYSFALLLYGGVSFVAVRIIGMLVLKLTNAASGAGMNLATSANTLTVGKLDAMWHMPAWGEMSLLPGVGSATYWGSFGNAPLSGSESVAMILIAIAVFSVVGLVGAFVVSFYFCGSTEMYLLLRRNVDAVDYDEIYYEQDEDELEEEAAPPSAGADDESESSGAADADGATGQGE